MTAHYPVLQTILSNYKVVGADNFQLLQCKWTGQLVSEFQAVKAVTGQSDPGIIGYVSGYMRWHVTGQYHGSTPAPTIH